MPPDAPPAITMLSTVGVTDTVKLEATVPKIGIGVFYPNYLAVILSHFSCYYIFVNKDERTPYVTY
jgi:hypothetical protein